LLGWLAESSPLRGLTHIFPTLVLGLPCLDTRCLSVHIVILQLARAAGGDDDFEKVQVSL
jgi:hypothetical protein